MKKPHKYNWITAFFIGCLLIFCAFAPTKAYSQAQCAKGVGVPPFLGEGLDPDLLLIIDNSGSMLDLAYVDPNSQCLDDTYNSLDTYAGYFEKDMYYFYDFANGRFSPLAGAWRIVPACAPNDIFAQITAAGHMYDVWIEGCVDGPGDLTDVVNFVGRGNFLNWAAASKLDIQKKILTGGKYDAAAGQFVMESRGCGARRHAKLFEVTKHPTNG